MITLKENDKLSLEKDLSVAIIKLSNGKLNKAQSIILAKRTVKNINFSNSALAHKGINWYAKKIIDTVDFDALK